MTFQVSVTLDGAGIKGLMEAKGGTAVGIEASEIFRLVAERFRFHAEKLAQPDQQVLVTPTDSLECILAIEVQPGQSELTLKIPELAGWDEDPLGLERRSPGG